MKLHFPHVSARLCVQSCPPESCLHVFGCFVVFIHRLLAIYGRGVFLFVIFSVVQFDGPNDGITSRPTLILQRAVAPAADVWLVVKSLH